MLAIRMLIFMSGHAERKGWTAKIHFPNQYFGFFFFSEISKHPVDMTNCLLLKQTIFHTSLEDGFDLVLSINLSNFG